MRRKVSRRELEALRHRVRDVLSCLLGRAVVDLDEAVAELERVEATKGGPPVTLERTGREHGSASRVAGSVSSEKRESS